MKNEHTDAAKKRELARQKDDMPETQGLSSLQRFLRKSCRLDWAITYLVVDCQNRILIKVDFGSLPIVKVVLIE